jgi:hypothetical protein
MRFYLRRINMMNLKLADNQRITRIKYCQRRIFWISLHQKIISMSSCQKRTVRKITSRRGPSGTSYSQI